MENHLQVASVRGTAEQLITYVSQYLEGAAENHLRKRDHMGATQEAFPDCLAALEDEFALLSWQLRCARKAHHPGHRATGRLCGGFSQQARRSCAAAATIAYGAARDIFVGRAHYG